MKGKNSMKQKKPSFKDDRFKEYRSALQWVFTDHKIETMEIKQRIHTNMKLVKRHLNWSNRQLFNFIMGQFVSSHAYLRHNRDDINYVTVMLRQADQSLLGLLKGIVKKEGHKYG